MKITVSASEPLSVSAELVAVGVAEGAARKGVVKELTKALGRGVAKAIRRSEFTGKQGQICEIATGGVLKAERVLLYGLGDLEKLTAGMLRSMVAKVVRRAATSSCTSAAVALPPGELPWAVRTAAEGAVLGSYRYERFKTEEYCVKHPLEKVALLSDGKVSATLRAEAVLGQQVGEAVCIARDLINAPPNELYPEALAEVAKELAKEHKAAGLTCKVLGPKEIKAKGMNLLDAVGRGSVRGPRLIHLKYRPKGKAKSLKRLVFVGKGLTFDTGGICIKPAAGMEDMKGDMGGAANVMALMAAVAVLQPEAEIHGIIPSAENMPDGNAYRPGDVFKSYQGKTVEIINTDAEGRLALADALHYAVELEPDMLLDNATLTGACVVALGATVSAYFSNREGLADSLKTAADTAGEAMWELPLVEDLRDKLKSDWADMKHMGDRWGGAITAALFLREFVGDTPWIHLDVAGPSMADKSYGLYSKGGTGHGVLTFLELIDQLIKGDDASSETESAG